MPIPKRIIQKAKTRDLSPLANASVANLKLLHPDWEHMLFDDEDMMRFMAAQPRAQRALFDAFPLAIQKVDYFRYLAVLKYGGFYFDLDVLLSEPLNELTTHACVFPFEELTINSYLRKTAGIDWELGNYAFGAAPDDPFLGAVAENCGRAQSDPSWANQLHRGIPAPFRAAYHVFNTTGPALVTRTYAEDVRSRRNVTILSPGNVCEEQNWHRFGRYGVHLMAASWRKRNNVLWRRIARLWENNRRRRYMAGSLRLGPTRDSVPAFA